MPQQEPGWGRIRPLAREPTGGNTMFPAGRVGWEEPVLGQDLQPGLSHQHLAGAGSDPAPGVLGSRGLWMGFSSHAKGHRVLGANISVLPPLHCDSGASPHHPGGSTRSLPWWRQQLSRTLFWMFMGFQFTPGSEAAKLPSQGGVIPRGRSAAWPHVEGGSAVAPSPCGVGGSLGALLLRGSLPVPKNLEQIKY